MTAAATLRDLSSHAGSADSRCTRSRHYPPRVEPLTPREWTALRQALLEVVTGDEVQDWEYPIRLGITKDEAFALLDRMRSRPEAGTND